MQIKILIAAAALAVSATHAQAQAPVQQSKPVSNYTRDFFYVGGSYVGDAGKEVMRGQMYVERLQPRQVKSRYPLVLIHGAAQTATNWLSTPDGRKGWADYFVEQGYVVYMVDQPARGRLHRLALHGENHSRFEG